jgi:hypothetical protein
MSIQKIVLIVLSICFSSCMMKDTTIRIVNLNNQQLLLNIIEHDKKVNSRGEEQCDSYSKINFDKGKIDLEAHNLSQFEGSP